MRGRLRTFVLVLAVVLAGFPAFAQPTSAGPMPAGAYAGTAAYQDGPTPIRFEFRYDGGSEAFHKAIEAAGGVWSNHLMSPVPVRVDVSFESLGAVISNRDFAPVDGNLATVFYPPNNQLETFVVGNDGAVHVIWKAQNENWQAPFALTAIDFAPPGAPVAAVHYPVGDQLEVFVVGNDGAVNVIWKAADGVWNGPVPLTAAGVVPPGGSLAAVSYPSAGQLEVFYSDTNGTIMGVWKANNGSWNSPFALSGTGFAPAGASIATAYYPVGDQLEIFVSDVNGAIAGFWKGQNGAWNQPFWLTGAGFAPAGGGLGAVYYPPNDQLELFVADVNGTIQVLWKAQNGAWNAPFALSGSGVTPAGTTLGTAYYPPGNQLEVLYIGRDGSWNVIWKAENGDWNDPVSISTGWVAPAGGPVALAWYPLNEQFEAFVIGVDGDVNLAWKAQNGAWLASDSKLASASGTRLRVTDDTFTPAPLREATVGENLNGDDADITMTINTNFDWYTGLDGQVPEDEHDLVSVVMHELGHGLGFSASTCRGGSGSCDATATTDAAFTQDGWKEVPYTTFLEDASGTRIDSYDLSQQGMGATLLATLTSGQVFWGGPAGIAANNDDKPLMFAPATWSPGSSISHLDEATFPAGDLNELMTPQSGRGESKQQPGAVTLGILSDLGWQVRAFPPPSPQPASTWSVYQPLNEQLEVLTIDGSGALTVRWKENNRDWNAPVALTGPGMAPPGAPVAVAFYPPNNQLEAFFSGNDGAVYLVWKAQNENWQPPVALTPAGTVSPGSPLTATYYPVSDQLEVFYVDQYGAMNVLWKAMAGLWNEPAQISPRQFALPGTSITSVYYPPNDQLEVLFVDANGAVSLLWKARNEFWNEPVTLTDPGIALFGTILSGVYYPFDEQLEVLFIDRWGAVNVLWKSYNGAWNPPAGLTPQGTAAPGSPIASVFYPMNEQLEAFFIDGSGALNVLYKVRNDHWEDAVAITGPGFAIPGDWVAASYYWLDTQLNVFVADQVGFVQLVWKANNSTWRDPTPLG